MEKLWVKDILEFKCSVTFVNIDSFEHWRNSCEEVKTMIQQKSIQKTLSRNLTEKYSIQKASQSRNPEDLLVDEELITSPRIYEDMTIYLIEKLIKFEKISGQAKNPEDRMILITPFNKEKLYLQSQLKHKGIRVLTIDKSQGIDTDTVVVLCSTRDYEAHELLANWRRVNVAFTRAKKRLILIGSKKQLKKIGIMSKFIDLLKEKDWIYNFEEEKMWKRY